jgi:uncharacterized membrane protein YsdA (DUF1294 family)
LNTKIAVYMILSWNLLVFIMFGIDKYKAAKGRWRISEKTLLLSSLFMGIIGGLLGMSVFRHKTKHLKFKLLMPLAFIVNIALVYLIFNKIL